MNEKIGTASPVILYFEAAKNRAITCRPVLLLHAPRHKMLIEELGNQLGDAVDHLRGDVD
jgi:hypothetical protein